MKQVMKSFVAGAAGIAALTLPAVALAAGGDDHGFTFGREGWYIVDFVIFVGLLFFFVKGPAKKFLVARHERVKTEIERASRMKAEAEAKMAEYERLMAGLDTEIAQIRDEFKADGERERERIIADAEATAERSRKAAERALEQEGARLKNELEHELVAKVLEEAEAALGSKLNAKAHRDLVNGYITDLEKLDKLGQFAA